MSAAIYLPLAEVAKVCVLTQHTLLTRFWPDHWGVPREWRMVRSTVLVNQAPLPDLARALRESGQTGTAELLERWLAENAAEAQRDDFMATRTATAAVPEAPWFRRGQFE